MREKFPELVEKSRSKHPIYPDTVRNEKNGFFQIKKNGLTYIVVISNGANWDHVSMSILRKKRCPSWEEMCWLKDLFFEEHETVVQYHPPKEKHVSMHPYCLHLWRYQGNMPAPEPIFVGVNSNVFKRGD